MAGRNSIDHIKGKAKRFCKDNDLGCTYEAEQELYPEGDINELLIIQGVIFSFEEGQLKTVGAMGGSEDQTKFVVRALAPEWLDKIQWQTE